MKIKTVLEEECMRHRYILTKERNRYKKSCKMNWGMDLLFISIKFDDKNVFQCSSDTVVLHYLYTAHIFKPNAFPRNDLIYLLTFCVFREAVP